MSNKAADEMFEELGYEIKINCKECICYKTKFYLREKYTLIDFDLENKTIQIVENHNQELQDTSFSIYKGTHKLTMQELQAINKKVKELGWLDE